MKRFLLICLLFTTFLNAQNTGEIVGKITDKELNNEPLPFANILIKGTSKGTTSDFDGLYSIKGLEPGAHTVVFSFVGYETQTVSVDVVAGKVTEINVNLGASAAALDEVVITTTARRDSEVALLLDQKKAIEIKQTIGAEELSRKALSDAEQAVQKTAGVSKQEGVKNVFVRGLGDRYNATTLNGLPLPSDDPEYKNISLDVFTTNIISSVDIDKVFGTPYYLDVAGANININSKEHTSSKPQFAINVSTGVNSITFDEDFKRMSNTNYFGTVNELKSPITNLNQYDFGNKYQPENQDSQINTGFGITYGNKIKVENGRISLFATAQHNSKYQYKEGEANSINSTGGYDQNLDYQSYDYNATQLAMINLKYFTDGGTDYAINSAYIHANSQDISEYSGFDSTLSEDETVTALIRRQQQNDNNLFLNQFLSNIQATEKLKFSIDASYNLLNAYEPDTKLNSFIKKADEINYSLSTNSAGDNQRRYIDLENKQLAGKLVANYNFTESEKDVIRLGYNYLNTKEDFNSITFAHKFNSPLVIDTNNVDSVFNQTELDNGVFHLLSDRGSGTNAIEPVTYQGDKKIHAGLIEVLYEFSEKFTVDLGARLENIKQELDYNFAVQVGGNPSEGSAKAIEKTYVLPSLGARYALSEDNIFRFGVSKTYILPRFKEVAPFIYNDVQFDSYGNPDLLPSDVYNVDLKWEYYFSKSELVSLTGFYKKIIDPINRVQINTSGNYLSYINVGDAQVYGAELEVRKSIWQINDDTTLDFGANISYLYSNQKLKDVPTDNLAVSFSKEEDELEGASPLLINADLKFSKDFDSGNKFTTSLLYGYFEDRIFSLGVQGSENIVENGVSTLDFVSIYELNHFKFNLGVKNLLDPTYKLTKDTADGSKTINIRTYKKGVGVNFGITYKF